MNIYLQGTIPTHHESFTLRFSMGQQEGSDVAFHMKACYDGRDRVVFNSYEAGAWMEEELKKEMPFPPGELFMLNVEVHEKEYQVLVNGSPFYNFTHRLPLGQVNQLRVDGDITVSNICICSRDSV
ncbi:galectin-4-like [Bombina bombina]|uniref:galectin-4-like n=1 Tax=Bombina bombina TaxID=8345 RepID=UPI00235A6E00|nr:galectin-4-like [Bombina bombina]